MAVASLYVAEETIGLSPSSARMLEGEGVRMGLRQFEAQKPRIRRRDTSISRILRYLCLSHGAQH